MTRARVRILVGVVLTLAIVGPLGWMWWNSRLPSSYSVMDMGYADYGGGPRPAIAASMADMAGMEHAAGEVSVAALDTPKRGRPDVVVDLTARQGKVEARLGQDRRRLHAQRHVSRPDHRGDGRPARRGAPAQRRRQGRRRPALARGRRAQRRGRRRRGHPGRGRSPGKDYTYRWVAPDAGTYWYHSHQMSQRAGVRRAARRHRRSSPQTRARRRATSSPSRTSTTASTTINGDTGDQRVPREARPAGPGAAGQHRQRRRRSRGPTCRSGWRAVDGVDVNQPDEVYGQGGRDPCRGPGRPEVLSVPTDGSAARVADARRLGAGRSDPRARAAPKVKQPDGSSVDLLDYGSPAPVGLRHQPLRPEVQVLHRPAARLHQRQARACGGASTATSTRTCR